LRPKPFVPEFLDQDKPFVRDKNSGRVWHQCELRTLYVDTDRSQVVYHANYLRYFEFGRASLMRHAAYPYKQIEESGYIYPIIKVEVNYYTPLFYDDLMLIHTSPATLELVKLQFDYIITNQQTGEVVCTGFTKHCAVNTSGTPVEIDDKTRELWQRFPK
jgi:acyl-CoA thioester hydrolase